MTRGSNKHSRSYRKFDQRKGLDFVMGQKGVERLNIDKVQGSDHYCVMGVLAIMPLLVAREGEPSMDTTDRFFTVGVEGFGSGIGYSDISPGLSIQHNATERCRCYLLVSGRRTRHLVQQLCRF